MNWITDTISGTASRLFARTAAVTAVTHHGEHLREIELTGPRLRDVTWNVGDKIQVRTAATGFTMRTYTPTSWDPERGSTTLLIHLHGDGPGCTWAREAALGTSCQFYGPNRSLLLDDPDERIVFVGDETSFALAAAWRRRHPDTLPVAALFEVTDPTETQRMLDIIGLPTAQTFARTGHAGHLNELSATLIDVLAAQPGAALCLTGKAQTIAHLRRSIKHAGVGHRTTKVKAYWDENRSGLD